jgi:hypothetical protein
VALPLVGTVALIKGGLVTGGQAGTTVFAQPVRQLAGILALTIGAAVALQALALIAAFQVEARALLARLVLDALVDVQMAVVAVEPGVAAVASVVIEQVLASARVAGVALAFVYLHLASLSGVPRQAGTRIRGQTVDGLASGSVQTGLEGLLTKVPLLVAGQALVKSGAVAVEKLVILWI